MLVSFISDRPLKQLVTVEDPPAVVLQRLAPSGQQRLRLRRLGRLPTLEPRAVLGLLGLLAPVRGIVTERRDLRRRRLQRVAEAAD